MPYRDMLLPVDAKQIAALRDSGSLEVSFQEPEDYHNPVAATAVLKLR
jgi:hypothetical protein